MNEDIIKISKFIKKNFDYDWASKSTSMVEDCSWCPLHFLNRRNYPINKSYSGCDSFCRQVFRINSNCNTRRKEVYKIINNIFPNNRKENKI